METATLLDLEQTVSQFLQNHRLLSSARVPHFVVAFSGGRDSVALLQALLEVSSTAKKPFKVVAAYYAHPWRPLAQDFEIIHKVCKRLNVQWVVLTPKLNIPKTEAHAREDRYAQLASLANDLGSSAIFTAHHEDDQIETILFRILRGTGIEGLVGIPPVRLLKGETAQSDIPLLRPLLALPRKAIDDYIQTKNLPYVEDPTNLDVTYKRNYIRHQLVPIIEAGFPQARQSILNLAEITANELSIIDSKINELWFQLFNEGDKSLDAVRFNQLTQPFQAHILRRFLKVHNQDAGHRRTQDILDFLTGKQQKSLGPGLFSIGSEQFITLYRHKIRIEKPKKLDILPVTLSLPCQLSHIGLKTTIRIIELTPEEKIKPIDFYKLKPNEVVVNLNAYTGKELVLRNRQTGDSIKPLGMSQPVKLKNILINRNIPRFERDQLPLLASGSEVLWALGVCLSENIKVKDKPTHRMIMEIYG